MAHTLQQLLAFVFARANRAQGYMVQWDLEKEIWQKAFKSAALSAKGPGNASGAWDPASTALLVTEPIFNFPAVQAATEEVGGRFKADDTIGRGLGAGGSEPRAAGGDVGASGWPAGATWHRPGRACGPG
jgi:hypothetical protein